MAAKGRLIKTYREEIMFPHPHSSQYILLVNLMLHSQIKTRKNVHHLISLK